MSTQIGRSLLIVLTLLVGYGSTGCGRKSAIPATPHPIVTYFAGDHALRKFVTSQSRPEQVTRQESHWWFLIVGAGGKKDIMVGKQHLEDVKIVFYWQLHDGTYGISELPLRDIRVEIDSTVTNPMIRFELEQTSDYYYRSEYYRDRTLADLTKSHVGEMVNNHVAYAVLRVRAEDWPINVQLPLN